MRVRVPPSAPSSGSHARQPFQPLPCSAAAIIWQAIPRRDVVGGLGVDNELSPQGRERSRRLGGQVANVERTIPAIRSARAAASASGVRISEAPRRELRFLGDLENPPAAPALIPRRLEECVKRIRRVAIIQTSCESFQASGFMPPRDSVPSTASCSALGGMRGWDIPASPGPVHDVRTCGMHFRLAGCRPARQPAPTCQLFVRIKERTR